MKYAIGLDIGGTNIKVLAVTPGGRVLAHAVVPTGDTAAPGWPRKLGVTLGSGGWLTRGWPLNVRRAKDELERAVKRPATWIGLAAPGLTAADQCSIAFMPGRLPGLEGLDWRKFLKATHPVPVLNDAHAALLGEVWCGAARRSQNAILLTLGTGVGGAALVDGRLLRGHIGRAGHLGHISLDPCGTPDVARTPGSLEDAIGDCTVKVRSDGRFASTQKLVAASNAGDRDAQQVWRKSVQALAAGIASLINVLDPEVVVVGGGIAQAGKALFRPLKKYLNDFEWRPGGRKVRVVPAKLGDRAGAFGAAWHAIHFPA
ncbi:MAG: ROK family protein [Verrucomicrobia subdivision 3 bacterium]|nr:ROK family protein [Limisphaerales bacterium]